MVKNIIFDFGNVLIDLDIPKTEQNFRRLMGERFNVAYEGLRGNDIFNMYEKGEFAEETFLWHFQHAFAPHTLSPREIINAWNGMLVGIPAHRFEWLKTLRNKYRLFLFSNTNETHLKWVENYLTETYQLTIRSFEENYFERAYFSHLIHRRKPDQEAFQFVLQDAGLQPETTLFIDDTEENILSAVSVGMHAIHLKPGMTVEEVLKEY